MRDWFDLLPPDVARKQEFWEERQRLLRMSSVGLCIKEIAHRTNRTYSSVADEITKAKLEKTSPFEKWAKTGGEIAALHRLLHPLKKREVYAVEHGNLETPFECQMGYFLSFGA